MLRENELNKGILLRFMSGRNELFNILFEHGAWQVGVRKWGMKEYFLVMLVDDETLMTLGR